MLADEGVLVASISEKNELIKVQRTHRSVYTESTFLKSYLRRCSSLTLETRPTLCALHRESV